MNRDIIQQIIDQLSIRVSILNKEDVIPDETLLKASDEPGMYENNQFIFCQIEDIWLKTENSSYGRDVFKMLHILSADGKMVIRNREDAWISLIQRKIHWEEFVDFSKQFLIPLSLKRTLVLFRLRNNSFLHKVEQILRELIPMGNSDALLHMGEHDYVLIREMDKDSNSDDVNEFVQATCNALETEEGINVMASISAPFDDVKLSASAFEQAQELFKIAEKYKLQGTVWYYNDLLLERLLNGFDGEENKILRKEILPDSIRKNLNKQILETVDTFFRCDLNVSDTARQMFIHRNTLMYRLDKIQKMTGLDLRKFRDAVVFQILMTIEDREEIRERE